MDRAVCRWGLIILVVLAAGCAGTPSARPGYAPRWEERRASFHGSLIRIGWLDSDLPKPGEASEQVLRVRAARLKPRGEARDRKPDSGGVPAGPSSPSPESAREGVTDPRSRTQGSRTQPESLALDEPIVFPFEPLGQEPAYPWRHPVVAIGLAAMVPADRSESVLKDGVHFTVQYAVDFTRNYRLELALGYYRAGVEPVPGLGISNPDMEAGTAHVTLQVGTELPGYVGRGYLVAGVGVFVFDKDEVADKDGNPTGEDFGPKVGIGFEFWSLHHPVRTQVEFSYLSLFDLEEQFYAGRLSFAVKF